MASDEVMVFTLKRGEYPGKWHVAEDALVRTPDGKDHRGLLAAILAWRNVSPGDFERKLLRLEERDD